MGLLEKDDVMATKPSSHSESEQSKLIAVLVTTASEEEAMTIGRDVVKQGLAACANILALQKSIFQWEGKLSEEQEFLMIIKSRFDLFEDLSVVIKRLHSYKVPEIVAIPIVKGSSEYMNWILDNTTSS
jgi:periplasmic divalent cation tolerance protein